MLVLTRKLGQNILIGEKISVKVLRIDSNKVQLGVSAPQSIAIYRQEIIDNIKDFNRLANKTDHARLKDAARFFKQLLGV